MDLPTDVIVAACDQEGRVLASQRVVAEWRMDTYPNLSWGFDREVHFGESLHHITVFEAAGQPLFEISDFGPVGESVTIAVG